MANTHVNKEGEQSTVYGAITLLVPLLLNCVECHMSILSTFKIVPSIC